MSGKTAEAYGDFFVCCWPSPEEAENKPEVFPSALKALQPPNKNTIIREDGLGPHPGFGLVQSSFPALVAAPLLCFPAAVPNSPTGSIPRNSVTSLNLQQILPKSHSSPFPQLTFQHALGTCNREHISGLTCSLQGTANTMAADFFLRRKGKKIHLTFDLSMLVWTL